MYEVTFKDAFKLYISDAKSRNLSPSTIEMYANAYKVFLETVDENIPIQQFSRMQIRQTIDNIITTRSSSTAARYFDILGSLFNWCINEELLEISPMRGIKRPKYKAAVIKPLGIEDIQKLYRVIDAGFTGARNQLIIAILFDTGLRATELCNLELDDIDTTYQTIMVRVTKTNRPRLIPYGNNCARLLAKYLVYRAEQETNRLIITCYGNPIDRSFLRRTIVRIGEKAGVKVTTHQLRHSCAVAMLRNGSDVFTVQKMLGHSTLLMTRHYSQLADSDLIMKHSLYSPADRLNCISTEKRKRIR